MKPFARTAKGGAGDDFVFPIYFDDDPQRRFERITYANNVINQGLQRAAKRIGLSRKITFYSARHTYASRLYHADVPLPLIAQNMGRNPAEIETSSKSSTRTESSAPTSGSGKSPAPPPKTRKPVPVCKPPCKPSRHARL